MPRACRRIWTAARSSTCRARSHPLDVALRAGRAAAPRRCRPCLRERAGQVLCFLAGRRRDRAARVGSCARSTARRGRRAPRIARRGGAGRGDCRRAAPPGHPRHQHRRNVADGSGRHGGRRHRPAQSRALRSRPRASTASRPSASPRTRPTSARAVPAGSGPAWSIRLWHQADRLRAAPRAGDPARRSRPAPCSTSSPGAAIPRTFDWFEAPARDRVDAAFELLERLGAIERRAPDRRRAPDAAASAQPSAVSDPARRRRRARRGRSPARCSRSVTINRCHAKSSQSAQTQLRAPDDHERSAERHRARTRSAASTCSGRRALLQSLVDGTGPARTLDESAFRRALLRWLSRPRRPPAGGGSPRVLLSSGHGAVVGPESGVRDGEFLVALDVMAGRPGEGTEARIRMASTVDRSWLTPTHTRVDHAFDTDAGRRARHVARLLRRAGPRRAAGAG